LRSTDVVSEGTSELHTYSARLTVPSTSIPDFIELKKQLEACFEGLPLHNKQRQIVDKSRNWGEVPFNSLQELISHFTEEFSLQMKLLA
jgi:hypothetical protein